MHNIWALNRHSFIQIITMKFTWGDSFDLGDGTVSYDPDLLRTLEPIPEVKKIIINIICMFYLILHQKFELGFSL